VKLPKSKAVWFALGAIAVLAFHKIVGPIPGGAGTAIAGKL
jgi:hypothetical protein